MQMPELELGTPVQLDATLREQAPVVLVTAQSALLSQARVHVPHRQA